MQGLILAAGRGSRLGKLTDEAPKCTVVVNGKSLLERQLAAMRSADLKTIGAVTGYLSHVIEPHVDWTINNLNWANTNIAGSLQCADAALSACTTVVSYGDIFYPVSAVRTLAECSDDIAMIYDPNWRTLWEARFGNPYSDAENFQLAEPEHGDASPSRRVITHIGGRATPEVAIDGQYMGLFRITPRGWQAIKDFVRGANAIQGMETLDMTSLFSLLIQSGIPVVGIPLQGIWGEVDHPEDIRLYETLYKDILDR